MRNSAIVWTVLCLLIGVVSIAFFINFKAQVQNTAKLSEDFTLQVIYPDGQKYIISLPEELPLATVNDNLYCTNRSSDTIEIGFAPSLSRDIHHVTDTSFVYENIYYVKDKKTGIYYNKTIN